MSESEWELEPGLWLLRSEVNGAGGPGSEVGGVNGKKTASSRYIATLHEGCLVCSGGIYGRLDSNYRGSGSSFGSLSLVNALSFSGDQTAI